MNYPDLKDSKLISFDIETFDPMLIELGNGVYRKDGNIIGVAIADENGFAEYYNIGHPGCEKEIRNKNLAYIKDVLSLPCDKLATNILYDMDWLENGYGIKINGRLNDVQVAEPLLDENSRKYNLDELGIKYLDRKKYKTEIDFYCEQHNLKGDARKHLWRMPYSTVRPYAIEDVLMPIEIFSHQRSKLKEEELIPLYGMEMELIPLLLQMRKQGVLVDKNKISHGVKFLDHTITEGEIYLYNKYGEFNYNSSKQIAKLLDNLGVAYGYNRPTEKMLVRGITKGNPCLDKEALTAINHDLTINIINVRTAYKIMNTFFINGFHNHSVDNRIHCEFKPLKSEIGGTKSGRFASARPNLQNIPAKEKAFGDLCRSVFIPEPGCLWGKLDYSQIEYRLIAHYAEGPRSEEIREKYNNDPNTDYHKLVMDWTGTNRKDAKVLNFGMAYAMGAVSMSKKFGWELVKSEQLKALYNEEVPFVKFTRQRVTNVARKRGYIKTILNRRARVTQLMREQGKEYSMFNRLIQGSAADLLKKGMLDSYKAGIFNVLHPHLTVHDELDVSIPEAKEGHEAFMELKHLMEQAIKLKVPVTVDAEIGKSWGELEDYDRNKYV